MAGIPDHVIEQIRERTDLVELVGRHVTLRKAGQRFVGLCPFHSEKTPSFTVNREKQFFHCFGCQAHGDLFAFRMRQEGLDFPDAARALAREAGVDIPEAGRDGGPSEALRRIHALAHEYFRERLRAREGEDARAYLRKRGTPSDLVERFQIGFAPPQWDGLVRYLIQRGARMELAEQAGLVAKRQTSTSTTSRRDAGHYDRFRGRLVFPICDSSGHVVAFGGRALADDGPKYLNSTENPIYRKGRVLFGLHLALDAIRRKERAIIVEGYFDAMALHRAGIDEVVAPCGTALTREHAQQLRRYAREVVLLFDGDTAGQRAADRSLPLLLAEGVRVRAAFLPAGEDPDTLLERGGAGALRDVVDRAQPFLDYRIDQVLGMERTHAWQAADRVRALAPYLNAIPDPVEQRAYFQALASRLGIEPGAVAEAVRMAGEGNGRSAATAAAPDAAAARADAGATLELDAVVRALVEELVAHPQLVEVLDTQEPPFQLTWLSDPASREFVGWLLDALRTHGERAFAWIFGSGAPPHVSRLLAECAAAAQTRGSGDAGTGIRDCLRELERRWLLRESAEWRTRLESCTEAGEQERILQELESLRRRREQLDREHRDERARTRIATSQV